MCKASGPWLALAVMERLKPELLHSVAMRVAKRRIIARTKALKAELVAAVFAPARVAAWDAGMFEVMLGM
jgi:hypothetical protein